MEEFKQKASDIEAAVSLIGHIENPCEDGQGHNIRDFYLREAKRIIPTMTNPYAREMLEAAVKKYE